MIIHDRHTIRLKGFDYSTPWWYYVTICTNEHIQFFGTVKEEKVVLSISGEIAGKFWQEIPKHFTNTEPDYFVVMPNHIRGIIISPNVETRHAASLQHKNPTLSDIVGSFKSAATKYASEREIKNFSWQSHFYDRIIHNKKELYNIRKYIAQNPLKWELEKDIPENRAL